MEDDDPRSQFGDIDARLKAARRQETRPSKRANTRPLGVAMRLSVEMAAGLAVGGFIGYSLDRWLGTGPWLLIVFFFLGAAAGFRNIQRAAREINQAALEGDDDDPSGEDGASPKDRSSTQD